MEILNIVNRTNQKSAIRLPKPPTRKMLKSLTKTKIVGAPCHRMSKLQLTPVETSDKNGPCAEVRDVEATLRIVGPHVKIGHPRFDSTAR